MTMLRTIIWFVFAIVAMLAAVYRQLAGEPASGVRDIFG